MVVLYDSGLLLAAAVDVMVSPRPGDFSITRLFSRALSLGGENRLGWEVENSSPYRLSFLLRDDLPNEFRVALRRIPLDVPARSRASACYHAVPERRGRYELGDVHVRYRSRLGLVLRQFAVARRDEVRVYPNLLDVARYHLLAHHRRLQEFGLKAVTLAGEGTEFESLREYRPGDPLPHIDWKATAKRHQPITKAFQAERSQTVLLVLDVGRRMSVMLNGLSRLDYSINAALMLAQVAVRQGDRVGLLAFSDRIDAYVPPRGRSAAFHAVLDALYNVQARLVEPDYDRACRYLALHQRKRSLILVFAEIPDRETCEPLLAYLARFARRHLAVCISLADPALIRAADQPVRDVSSAYTKATAAQLLLTRSEALQLLRGQGVTMLECRPDTLTPAVVNEYLRLKYRARL
jgi:uncharacterized protein (DUF58 family)